MTTDPKNPLPPRLDPTCTCICHTQPGVMHVAPCCWEADPKDAEIARLTAELAESEAAAEGALMILVQTQAERDAANAEARERRDLHAQAIARLVLMERERDAALAQVARLQHRIRMASDPDFIWGAMDNVNDMDVGLDEFAKAASRAIRAAVLAPADTQAAPASGR